VSLGVKPVKKCIKAEGDLSPASVSHISIITPYLQKIIECLNNKL
jgi:hypothetical protein